MSLPQLFQTHNNMINTTTKQKTNSDYLNWWDKTHSEASTMARWIAMYEAVNIVADKADEKKIAPENVVYKPKAIQDYIEKTHPIILRKLLEEDYKIQICYSEEPSNLEMQIV